jgi:hypothetical protein
MKGMLWFRVPKGPFKNNFGFWRERRLALGEARGGLTGFAGKQTAGKQTA